ncbi:MAG TPA: YkgJ family cysteine cluster protein [Candidatus Deferrimicrobium sp.]|nr:YkgJ family cysteine cluster protein [Candidatus Deferrimicrobium sp.]
MDFKCEQCSQCCSDPALIVTLTHRDLLRFEFFLPDIDLFKIVAFYQIPDKDKTLEKRLMSPVILTNRGKIILGLQKKDTKCVFLQGNECQIYECRPQICRSFPYTFKITEDQIHWGYSQKANEYCPAVKKDPPINTEQLEAQALEMHKESGEFKQLVYVWNNLAEKKLINPAPELLLQFLTGKLKLTVENLKK